MRDYAAARRKMVGLPRAAQMLWVVLQAMDGNFDRVVQVSNRKLIAAMEDEGSRFHRAYRELEARGLILRLTVERQDGGYEPTVYILRDVPVPDLATKEDL